MKHTYTCGPGSCGPNGRHGSTRSFLTKEEKIEMLKEHREAIKKEAQGISEYISELEKGE